MLVTCSHQFILFLIIAPRIRAEFSKARKILSKQACVILYKAMILPLFDYCCVIRDGCGKTNQQYLEKLQRRAAGIIEGHRVNQTDLIHIISWPSLGLRRVYRICLLVHQPRKPGSLPTPGAATKTLVQAGHVPPQNLGYF